MQNGTNAQEPKLILPIGHSGFLNSASFSYDDKKIVTASEDHMVKIWDAVSGELLANLNGHTSPVNNACFSPDGSKIISSSNDHTAKLWNAKSSLLIADLRGHTDIVLGALFSPDGKKIITASADHTAKIWDAINGKLLFTLVKHTDLVNTAVFSPDSKKIITASDDHTAIIWNALNGQQLIRLEGHSDFVNKAIFSPDGKKIVTGSADNTIKIWDALNGQLLFTLKGHTDIISNVSYSPNGLMITTTSDDSTAKIWNALNGTMLADLKHDQWVNSAIFSPDGKKIVTASEDENLGKNNSFVKIWDVKTGALISLEGHAWGVKTAFFSSDGKRVVTASKDHTAAIWDIQSKKVISLKGRSHYVNSAGFSPDNMKIFSTSSDGTAKIWDAQSGSLLDVLEGHIRSVVKAAFSPDNKKLVTASESGICKIWNVYDGNLLSDLTGHTRAVYDVNFSPDGKKIVTASADKTVKIWDAETGLVIIDLTGHTNLVTSAAFSPDGTRVITASSDSSAKIWDAQTGLLLLNLKGHSDKIVSAAFSPDGKIIVTSSFDSTAKIWDAQTGISLAVLKGHTDKVLCASFSPDGKKIITGSMDFRAKIWDVATGKIIADLKGHKMWVVGASFSPDGKKIVTASRDNTATIWDAETGSMLYSFFAFDYTKEYLIVDKQNRYDGSDAARQTLYYTCGTEIITLQQLKDKLWVPNLAERINKGDTINSSGLSELDICRLIPRVELNESKTHYQFTIQPQRGGLGETAVFVNGIEARRYKASALKNNAGKYLLVIPKTELENFFVSGTSNQVVVKAYTSDNTISSRGGVVTANVDSAKNLSPNLYAVMIGVSDYKGDELDLKYAAKDATDLSSVISNAAKKLLNTKGINHVFMYNLTTPGENYKMPEKKSVKMLLEEIGTKAKANDILLIFFAGHGVMAGKADKKQFYFLSADASQSAIPNGIPEVGISANELTEWIKPQKIKAQKRILIFDACNSGQAIRDFVKIGNADQGYISARNDDKSQMTKAIDRLNEKSGLFILSASASNQNAYEMGRYSQGILTYSLIKAIKQQPDILNEGKYLDVSKWFNTAKESVLTLSKESGARQEPQIISNTNFIIGVVDEEVMAKITLPEEKPLFAACNFQNADENNPVDNLSLNKLVDQQLNNISSRGAEAPIVYAGASSSKDAYILSGRYNITGNTISIKVFIIQNKEVKQKIDLTGNTDKLEEFTALIATQAADWTSKKK